MEEYSELMSTALEHLARVRRLTEEIKGQVGSLDRKESLLTILDLLDEVDVALLDCNEVQSRQRWVFEKQKKDRVLRRTEAGIHPLGIQ